MQATHCSVTSMVGRAGESEASDREKLKEGEGSHPQGGAAEAAAGAQPGVEAGAGARAGAGVGGLGREPDGRQRRPEEERTLRLLAALKQCIARTSTKGTRTQHATQGRGGARHRCSQGHSTGPGPVADYGLVSGVPEAHQGLVAGTSGADQGPAAHSAIRGAASWHGPVPLFQWPFREGWEGEGVARWLARTRPFEVSLEDVAVVYPLDALPRSQLLSALNGAIVGLCSTSLDPPSGSVHRNPTATGTGTVGHHHSLVFSLLSGHAQHVPGDVEWASALNGASHGTGVRADGSGGGGGGRGEKGRVRPWCRALAWG